MEFLMRHELLRSCTFITSLIIVLSPLCAAVMAASIIRDQTYTTWSQDHVKMIDSEQALRLTLDSASGSGFASNQKFLYGSISMEIKLMAGDSAGTVTAYYLSSEVNDELDFEFLGNLSGEPYLLQTNVYANGTSGREHRVSLWFDPSAEYHTYSFLWNKHHAVFMVDSVPIRIFTNNQALGVPYLMRPMRLYASIWNGDFWATRGGQDKINWDHAPFVASYRNFTIDACVWQEKDPDCNSANSTSSSSNIKWWEEEAYEKLSSDEASKFDMVQRNYTVYDYCKDVRRYPILPAECNIINT